MPLRSHRHRPATPEALLHTSAMPAASPADIPPSDVSPTPIAERVVQSILAQKLAPGERLGEQELADLFGVSRTMVREALMQLQARGFIEVRPRRGWYAGEPAVDVARDAFSGRSLFEAGLLAEPGRPLQAVIPRLRAHIAEEQQAIEGADAA